MRQLCVPQGAGSDVMPPAAFKRSRANPIAAAAAQKQRFAKPSTTEELLENSESYESFNEGFATDGRPLRWSARSKRARGANSRRGGVAAGDRNRSKPTWADKILALATSLGLVSDSEEDEEHRGRLD